jgi:hypothetical protein
MRPFVSPGVVPEFRTCQSLGGVGRKEDAA